MIFLMADVSVARADGLHALAGRWQAFGHWWLSELRKLVPSGWLHWVDGEANPRLLIRRDGNDVVCRLSAEDQVEDRFLLQGFGPAALKGWLAERGLGREQVTIAPVIPRDCFLLRHLSVPKAALSALPTILEQELARRTPFQLADVWHAAIPAANGAGNVQSFCHWIVRRDRAEAALADLGLTASEVDCFAAADEQGEFVPVISLRPTAHEDPAWACRAVKLLAVISLGTAMLGFVVFEWRQTSVATRLEVQLAEARAGVQSGHAGGVNQAARLFAMKADAGILEIWDELSRVLPDNAFLTETRIANGKVIISGFSADAARLVRVIDQSPLFSGATLATAITPDATEQKDRFSINFKVRGARTVLPPASDRGAP
jgi:general secretion pathway protein L